jgi:hypothetical protein
MPRSLSTPSMLEYVADKQPKIASQKTAEKQARASLE